MAVRFISHTRLIAETSLNGSIDESLTKAIITQSQDRHIWNWLGTSLYDRLKADIIAGNVTGDYETLLQDYIQPALVQFTFAELLPQIRVRVVNNAVQIMSSEQSDAAGYEDIRPLINRAMDLGEFYRERMIDFLCKDSTSIPEYDEVITGELSATRDNYQTGLYLGSYNDDRIEDTLRSFGIL